MSNRTMLKLQQAAARARVEYSITRLGGGVTSQGISFPGGLDQTTPSLALQPGALRDILNYECSQAGGYGRIQGYERFSGQVAPSTAGFIIVQVSSFASVPAVGALIQQANTGATGTVALVNNVAGSTYMVVTMTSGTFNQTDVISQTNTSYLITAANAPLLITAANAPFVVPFLTTIGTAITPTVALTSQLSAQYVAAAADIYRAAIGPVPGSGAVSVVGMAINGVDQLFAFRANAAATAVNIYKASATGWMPVPFFNILTFTNGAAASTIGPADGGTLSQGGVTTSTMMRVMWQSGTWLAGTAAGAIVVTTPVGPSFAAGFPATTSDGFALTIATTQAPITLVPGGKLETVKGNFSGQLRTRRIYGCDGLNQCFEFDGVTLSPITTGLVPDRPSHIAIHKGFLWVSQASSISHSGAGTPFMWSAISGGGEIATGDIVTGMITLPGSQTTATLGVWLRGNTAFLYGIDPASFNLVTFNTGQGALPGSIQNLADTFVFDSLGVVSLRTSLNYGNFLPNTLTKNILPFILAERTKIVTSNLQRSKSQYRVYFSDGYGLWVTVVNSQYLGAAVVLFPNPVFSVDDVDLAAGGQASYFGSSDGLGYVYQMDSGTSFDGANIDARITLAIDTLKTPELEKFFRAASIEIASSSYAAISFGYQLGYGSNLIGQPNPLPYTSNFSPAPMWDAFTWDAFTWDGVTLLPTRIPLNGTAENIQVTITSSTNYIAAFNLNSIVYHFTKRRGLRV